MLICFFLFPCILPLCYFVICCFSLTSFFASYVSIIYISSVYRMVQKTFRVKKSYWDIFCKLMDSLVGSFMITLWLNYSQVCFGSTLKIRQHLAKLWAWVVSPCLLIVSSGPSLAPSCIYWLIETVGVSMLTLCSFILQ